MRNMSANSSFSRAHNEDLTFFEVFIRRKKTNEK